MTSTLYSVVLGKLPDGPLGSVRGGYEIDQGALEGDLREAVKDINFGVKR